MECNMLGDKLRWLRQYAGYPQWRVAEIIGKDRSTYAYYETGQRMVPPHVLSALADLYDVSVDYLLGRTDKMR